MSTRAGFLLGMAVVLSNALAIASAGAVEESRGRESPGYAGSQASAASLSSSAAERRAALQKAEEEERARSREEDLKLIEWARRDRERKALEEEKARQARKQRAQETLGSARPACMIKPVMSDAEIESCRRAGR